MGEINTRTVVMVVIVFLSMVFSLHGESFIRWRKEWVGIYRSTDLQIYRSTDLQIYSPNALLER